MPFTISVIRDVLISDGKHLPDINTASIFVNPRNAEAFGIVFEHERKSHAPMERTALRFTIVLPLHRGSLNLAP